MVPEAPRLRQQRPHGGHTRQCPGPAALPPRGAGARAREIVGRMPAASKDFGGIAGLVVEGQRCQKFGAKRHFVNFSIVGIFFWDLNFQTTIKLLMK